MDTINRRLMDAVAEQDLSSADVLIRVGADVNARHFFGITPLMVAALGDVEILRLLLDSGADAEAVGEDGSTALSLALKNGREDNARILQEFNDRRKMPLDMLCQES